MRHRPFRFLPASIVAELRATRTDVQWFDPTQGDAAAYSTAVRAHLFLLQWFSGRAHDVSALVQTATEH